MAETTGISWTRSTFNPWIGCTKVGPGCDHCYAETLDINRLSKTLGGATKEKPILHWGAGARRYRTSEQLWNGPKKWNAYAKAELERGATWQGTAGFWPVFCASLADVFDNEVAGAWRMDLWKLIEATPHLTWQLVTKRIGNVHRMVPDSWSDGFPPNVWLISTMVNQEEFDRDWPKLEAMPARVRGLSIEPMLGPIVFPDSVRGLLHWAIYGGESKQGGTPARRCEILWIEDGIKQCRALGIAPFVKQLGHSATAHGVPILWGTGKRGDPAEWHETIQLQEFPK